MAYGVSHVNGRFATWRIFYIAIGVLTMLVGLFVAIFLPDSPVKARRFTDAEKVAALLRVKGNQRYVSSRLVILQLGLGILCFYGFCADFNTDTKQRHTKRPSEESSSSRNVQRYPYLARLSRNAPQLDPKRWNI